MRILADPPKDCMDKLMEITRRMVKEAIKAHLEEARRCEEFLRVMKFRDVNGIPTKVEGKKFTVPIRTNK